MDQRPLSATINYPVFERLASPLGIMGEQLSASLKPIEHHGTIALRGLRGLLTVPPLWQEMPVSRMVGEYNSRLSFRFRLRGEKKSHSGAPL